MIRGIFCDLDGSLIDSKELHYYCLNQALKEIANITINEYEQKTIYDGLTTVEKLHTLSSNKGLNPIYYNKIKELKQKLTIEQLIKFKPTRQFKGLFKNLKNKGYKIAICSNSIRKTVDLIIDKLQLSSYIDLSLSNENIQFPKPNSEIYIKAMEYFQFQPFECVAVEDGKYGIIAAKNAGLHVIEVDSPNDVHEKLQRFLNEQNT